MRFVRCQCGKITGVYCEAKAEAMIEWMPRHLRASHEAANNQGAYPQNGSLRLPINGECLDYLMEYDADWTEIFYEQPVEVK